MRGPSYTGGTIDHHVVFWKYVWDICVRHQMRDRFRNSPNESQWALNCIQNVWTQHQTGLWFSTCLYFMFMLYIYILASLAWFIQDLQFSGVVLGFGRDGSTTNRLFHVILGFQGWHYWQVGTTGTWQGTCALLLLLAELQSWVKLIPITMFEKYAIMITVKVRSIIALEIMWQES